ncbi:transcription termination/antitermination protein NusA [Desulfuribacillus stibiiarsenatis]|uniref:Transcription termination/antitermination protein NusA n=1 Tax=Desulfuribacillus stibiiarsenatis TaxID=1390249 RepID=A0A1E5L6V5_9FIRM|nr:transcription termination factor NusA [Desulfuribacillus stibiiarsenatis]OEH85856.1 transcription termination/antitermination protein NusA [Desulfuribacillus stibiiarsenatis]
MKVHFLDALYDLEKEKGINREVLLEAIEAALITGYKKNFNQASNVRVNIDRENGTVKVYARKTIVEEVEDFNTQMSLEAAKRVNPVYQEGDIIEVEVTPKDFGRIAAQTAKQVVTQRIREAERGIIYEEYADRADDIITGLIQRKDAKSVYIELGKTEAVLPLTEQIPNEIYKPNDRIKVYISKVEKTTKGPQILVSRTHSGLLKRLFELEVPEIYEGIVEIKSVAREAGQRSKIAVHSNNQEVDPVGACVGPKGLRVQTIVNELKGEKIDIVRWSVDPAEYVANSLSPSKVVNVRINETDKSAFVVVPDYQLSLAIGKEGQNARLAAKLTNWKIDIKSESQYELAVQEGKIEPFESSIDFSDSDMFNEE